MFNKSQVPAGAGTSGHSIHATLAIDICLMFLMEAVSPREVSCKQGPGLARPVMAWLGWNQHQA